MKLSPRTDYLVHSATECLFILSATPDAQTLAPNNNEGGKDKAPSVPNEHTFCAWTRDGGRSFEFTGWVVPPDDPYRATMPSTVRCANGELVATVRRRALPTRICWVDVYASDDEGHTWSLLGKVGETSGHNGNPPALIRLADGRLCCAYGRRDQRQMVACLSTDQGRTWQSERILRDDFAPNREPDFGYPRMVQCAGGKIFTAYYWATAEQSEQHIAATLWDPDEDHVG